jgi:hypothetical protein
VNPISRLLRWFGEAREAGRLRKRARQIAEPADRVALLERAVALDDSPSARMELAVACARCGRLDRAAASWRRAVEMKPVTLPSDEEVAALTAVLPLAARDVLEAMMHGRRTFGDSHWKLERRGALDGDERWKLEQKAGWTMEELLPKLRFVALLIAHTAEAPGRVRIDCDRLDTDSERSSDIVQVGEAIVSWDEHRRITQVRVQ